MHPPHTATPTPPPTSQSGSSLILLLPQTKTQCTTHPPPQKNQQTQGLEKGLPIVNMMENWDFLQIQARSGGEA